MLVSAPHNKCTEFKYKRTYVMECWSLFSDIVLVFPSGFFTIARLLCHLLSYTVCVCLRLLVGNTRGIIKRNNYLHIYYLYQVSLMCGRVFVPYQGTFHAWTHVLAKKMFCITQN